MGARIARATDSTVDVLAVAPSAEQLETVVENVERAIRDLDGSDIRALHSRVGALAEEAIQEASAGSYDLLVIGSRGRRGIKRILFGSLAVRVMEHTPVSVLIVKGRKSRLKRFLICSAAGPASERAVQAAGELAQAMDASVTLMHVMSQVPLTQEACLADLEAPAEELIERCSREGVHLNHMLGLLAAEGTKARAVVRHGLVVEEIVEEAREGRFDLLVIGAHVTPGINKTLVGDLAEQILLAADLPVLVLRHLKPEE